MFGKERMTWMTGLGAALVVMLASACGGEAEPKGAFYEMLKLVPDTAEARFMLGMNDYARIREACDIPRPGPYADEEELLQYLIRVHGALYTGEPCSWHPPATRAFISSGGQYAQTVLPERKANLGFGFQDVDQDIQTLQPPRTHEAIRGRFDPSATEEAISGCTECPPPTRITHGGVLIYSWGEDLVFDVNRRCSPPAYDALGRGGRIAVQEGHVFYTVWTEGIEQMIDASQGKRASLADIREFALMATTMSEMGAYSVMMSDQVQDLDSTVEAYAESASEEEVESIRTQLTQEPALGSYRTLGIGSGEDESGLFMAVVLVYDDSSQAEADVAAFRRRIEGGTSLRYRFPWKDLVDAIEVSAVGRTLRARLWGRIAVNPYDFLVSEDPLLLQR